MNGSALHTFADPVLHILIKDKYVYYNTVFN